MEKYIFYCYQKFKKTNDESYFKKFFETPKLFLVSSFVLIFSNPIAFGLYYFKKNISWLLIIPIAIFCYYIVMSWYSEKYLIDKSTDTLENFVIQSNKTYKFLQSFNIYSEEDIDNLIQRTQEQIVIIEKELKLKNENLKTLFNIIIIPITIAIISSIFNRQTNILFIFVSLCCILFFILVVLLIFNIKNNFAVFNRERVQLNKMQSFIDELIAIKELQFGTYKSLNKACLKTNLKIESDNTVYKKSEETNHE